jgi:hypothetical protein
MGFIKLPVNKLISCDSVMAVGAAISSNTLTVDVVYTPLASGDELLKNKIVYTKGGSNSFTKTEAEYVAMFVEAVEKMSGATGSSVAGPIVEQKVTSSGALVGEITPSVSLKLTAAITA